MSSSNNPIKYLAAGVAAVAIAFGAYTLGNSNSGTASAGTANAAPPAAVQNGQVPSGGPVGGFGTPVTGTAATKVKDAVLAKYSGASIERIMHLQDGSYVAHVFTNGGELHVTVSKDYKVTGAQQGGPGGGTPPSGGQGAAAGTPTQSGTSS